MLRLISWSVVLKSCLWPWVICAQAGVTLCCTKADSVHLHASGTWSCFLPAVHQPFPLVDKTVPKGLLNTQDKPDVSAHHETSHLCFFLDTLLLLHLQLLHCEVMSSNSQVRNAAGKKQIACTKFILSGLRCEQWARFYKVQKICFEVLSYKTCSFKASYMFAFLSPMFSLQLRGLLFDKEHKFWRIHLIQNFQWGKCHVLKGSCSKCQSCSLLPAGLGV